MGKQGCDDIGSEWGLKVNMVYYRNSQNKNRELGNHRYKSKCKCYSKLS